LLVFFFDAVFLVAVLAVLAASEVEAHAEQAALLVAVFALLVAVFALVSTFSTALVATLSASFLAALVTAFLAALVSVDVDRPAALATPTMVLAVLAADLALLTAELTLLAVESTLEADELLVTPLTALFTALFTAALAASLANVEVRDDCALAVPMAIAANTIITIFFIFLLSLFRYKYVIRSYHVCSSNHFTFDVRFYRMFKSGKYKKSEPHSYRQFLHSFVNGACRFVCL
jgi:hypothetical protein